MLGLPPGVTACLFDMDGVVTKTATVHAAAWKEMFDEYLRQRADAAGAPFVPFDQVSDYGKYVDGRPRQDGTRTFLASRDITLPEGAPDDPPSSATVWGLSNRKNEILQQRISGGAVEIYPGTISYIRYAKKEHIRTAVVTSSRNAGQVLRAAGLDGLFDVQVDGLVAARLGLAGKPAPDTYLEAARELGAEPGAAAVYEDALAGVAAGRAGEFALVVGVNRTGQAEQLRAHGADVVVSDLAELMER